VSTAVAKTGKDDVMTMYAPVLPGEFITETYLDELGLSGRQLADALGVAPSTVSRLLRGDSAVTGEMALRLAKAFDTTAELWMNMQQAYDLWEARSRVDVADVHQVWWRKPENGESDSAG